MWNFQDVFLIISWSLFANLKLLSAFYLWNVFSLQVGNSKEVKQNCKDCYNLYFLSYVMFDQRLKITFRKSSASPLKKPTLLFLFTSPPKTSKKCKSPLFCQHWKFFRTHCRKGGGHYELETLNLSQYWLHV